MVLKFFHENSSLEEAEFVVFGLPLSRGSDIKKNKYSLGPKLFRECSKYVFYPIFNNLPKICDVGDLNIEDLSEFIYKVRNKKIVAIGGNHLITYYILRAIKKYEKDFVLLFFDSHPDIEPISEITYSSFLYHLLREKILRKENLLLLGINNPGKNELDFLRENNIIFFTSYDLYYNYNDIISYIVNLIKEKKIYISIDLDVLNVPIAHWYEPMGIDFLKLIKIFRDISNINKNLIGFDIVELKSRKYCKAAVKLAVELIAMFGNAK